jgi:phospholipase D1/2
MRKETYIVTQFCDLYNRYDDEKHSLFHDLDIIYGHDFLQNNFAHANLKHGGPREPWHDAHSRLEGQAAWDVLTNFEQRWKKQSPPDLQNCLFDISPENFLNPMWSDAQESWNVQVISLSVHISLLVSLSLSV